jgi:ABC-type phosphate transport system substrate-binding protein
MIAVAGTVAPAFALFPPALNLFVDGSTTVYPISQANAGSSGPFGSLFTSSDTVVNFGSPGSPAVAEQPGSGAGRNCLLLGQIDVADSSGTFSGTDNTQSSSFNNGTPGNCNNAAPGSPTTYQWATASNPTGPGPGQNQGQVDVYTVAEDAIVPFVNSGTAGMPGNVTQDNLAFIYGCQVFTWNQVGNPLATSTATIIPVARENTSGTYDSFNKLNNLPDGAEEACMGDATYHNPNNGGGTLTDSGGNKVTPAEGSTITFPVFFKGPAGGGTVFTISAKNANAAPRQTAAPDMVTYVTSHPNSVGYAGLGNAVGSGISVTQVNGITGSIATVHNCYNGGSPCYPLQRKLFMATLLFGLNPEGAATYARATDFINTVLSANGQTLVQNTGFVPLIDSVQILDADVNLDFVVDISDLALIGVAGTWNTNTPGAGTPGAAPHQHWIRADVNRDGQIDIADLAQIGFASNWNKQWTLSQK